MGNRLDQDRQDRLEPKRITHARKKITSLGYEITRETDRELQFTYKDETVKLYPYSGWHTGKSIRDGRGLSKLLTQIKPS